MNKKFILVLTLVILHYSRCHSQLLKKINEIEVGVGPNTFITSLPSEFNFTPKIGVTGSLNLVFKTNSWLSIVPRIFYDRKGYIGEYVTYIDTIKGTARTETFSNLIGLCLLSRINLKNSNLHFDIGPYGSQLFSGYYKTHYSQNNLTYSNPFEKDKSIYGGLILGVGYGIPLSTKINLFLFACDNWNITKNSAHTFIFQVGINYNRLNNTIK